MGLVGKMGGYISFFPVVASFNGKREELIFHKTERSFSSMI